MYITKRPNTQQLLIRQYPLMQKGIGLLFVIAGLCVTFLVFPTLVSLHCDRTGNICIMEQSNLIRSKDTRIALHRIKSDEIRHFYAGAPLAVHVLSSQGEHLELKVGPDFSAGESFQIVVAAGYWFGAEVSGPGEYSLVDCTVAPGFDFADFQLANRSDLQQEYPQHKETINRFTRLL